MDLAHSKLSALTLKELKEVTRERVALFGLVLGPIIVYLAMGLLLTVVLSVQPGVAPYRLRIAVVPIGGETRLVRELANSLNASLLQEPPPPGRFDAVVIVDSRRLSQALNTGRSVPLQVNLYTREYTLMSILKVHIVERTLEKSVLALMADRFSALGCKISPDTLLSPASLDVRVVVEERVLRAGEYTGLVFTTSLSIPLALLVVLLSASQVAAVSLAVERENRMLEKLLSLPLKARDIVFSKVLAVALLSSLGTISSTLGLVLYAKHLGRTVDIVGEAPSLGALHITPASITLVALGVAVTLYNATIVGLLVGTRVRDARGAQLQANYATLLLSAPLLFTIFGVLPPDSPILLAEPYTPVLLTVTGALTGSSSTALVGLTALIVYSMLLTVATSRLLKPENLLTAP